MGLNESQKYLHSGAFIIEYVKKADKEYEQADVTENVLEVIQAGDIFLLKLKCPCCRELIFQKYPLTTCSNCDISLRHVILEEPPRKKQRLLAGSKRKKSFSKKTIKLLFELQNNSCAYCLKSFQNTIPNIEHIIPLSFGGSNQLNNLVMSCRQCNKIAGSLVFPNFIDKQSYVTKVRKTNHVT